MYRQLQITKLQVMQVSLVEPGLFDVQPTPTDWNEIEYLRRRLAMSLTMETALRQIRQVNCESPAYAAPIIEQLASAALVELAK